jgi:trigger factor
MNIEIEEIDSCNRKIKFSIAYGDYQNKIKSVYQNIGREVKVPGFRKGKVPASLLEKQFGPQVKKEALSELINERMTQAIEEKGLRAVGPPHTLDVQAEEGTDIEVSASLEVLPDFELKDNKDIEIDLKVQRVTDEEVDQIIESFRTQAAKNIQVTDRKAQDQDYLKIDFKGMLDGEVFEGGEAKDYVIQLGTNQLIEGLEKALVGMSIGEVKNTKVKIPEGYANEKLSGKEVDFEITLSGIQVKELPELNDEFAKTADPKKKYAGLEDMKNKIREELEGYQRQNARKEAQKQLMGKIVDHNPINLPEGLIRDQVRFMVEQEKKKQGESHDHDHDHDHPHSHDEDPQKEISAGDEEKHRASAIRILQEELLMDKLATDLKVDVSSKEFDAELGNIAQLLGGGDVEKLKKEWAKSGALARLHSKMRRDKSLNLVMDQVKIKEETVDRKEIIADN